MNLGTDAFVESPLGAFVESPLGVRGFPAGLVVPTTKAVSGGRLSLWDGLAWHYIQSGTLTAPRTVGVFENKLHQGRRESNQGVSLVMRRVGDAWEDVGTLPDSQIGATEATVYAMVAFGGELHIAGSFYEANGGTLSPATALMRWTGTQWATVGASSGLTHSSGGPRANCAITLGGALYVGGSVLNLADGAAVNRIVRWSGSAFTNLGGGPTDTDGQVHIMAAWNGNLVIGGWNMTKIDAVTINNLAQWNGAAWSALGGTGGSGLQGDVYALLVFEGDLYVGGDFDEIGGTTGFGWIARLDSGGTWHKVGGGFTPQPFGVGVWGLVNHDGQLYAVGDIAGEDGGDQDFEGIARWNGSSWESVDPLGFISDTVGVGSQTTATSFIGTV